MRTDTGPGPVSAVECGVCFTFVPLLGFYLHLRVGIGGGGDNGKRRKSGNVMREKSQAQETETCPDSEGCEAWQSGHPEAQGQGTQGLEMTLAARVPCIPGSGPDSKGPGKNKRK